MMQQIKVVAAEKGRNFSADGPLPENIVDAKKIKIGFEAEQYSMGFVIFEYWERLKVPDLLLKPLLDSGAVFCARENGDIMEPCHLETPLPADFRLGTFPGPAGIRRHQYLEPRSHWTELIGNAF